MQLISGAQQRSAHAPIEILCLRGRSLYSGWPVKKSCASSSTSVTSNSSSCAMPTAGQPVIARTASPQPPRLVSPASSSAAITAGSASSRMLCSCTFCRVESSASLLPCVDRELSDRAHLCRGQPPCGELDAEHERPDLRLVVVEAPPLEPDDVLLRHVCVAGRDQRRQLVHHHERRLLALQPLDAVALEHELERRRLPQRAASSPAPSPACLPAVPEWTEVAESPGASHLPARHLRDGGGSQLDFAPDGLASRLRRLRRARSLSRS